MNPLLVLLITAASLLGVAVLIWGVAVWFTAHMLSRVAQEGIDIEDEEGDD